MKVKKMALFITMCALILAVSVCNVKILEYNDSIYTLNILPSKAAIALMFTDMNYNSNYYLFDTKNSSASLLYRQPKNDFDTFTYSSKQRLMFYSKYDSARCTQIYKYHLSTRKTDQITNNLAIADFMFYDNQTGNLFSRVVQKKHRNFQILKYNVKASGYKIWGKTNQDESVKCFDYDPNSRHLLAVIYSVTEQYKKLDKANRNHTPFENPTYSIWLCNAAGEKIRRICTTTEDVESVSLGNEDHAALINIGANGDVRADQSVCIINMQTGKMKGYLPKSGEYENFQYAQYAPNSNDIFLLANKKDSPVIKDQGESVYPKYLLRYNPITKKYALIFIKYDGIINYFSVLR